MLHGHAQPNSREKLIHKLRELIYAMRVIMIVVSSVHAIETWLISIPMNVSINLYFMIVCVRGMEDGRSEFWSPIGCS